MITLKQYGGVALITIGAILLVISYIVGWTSNNLVLLLGLAIIIIGVVLHIKQQKKGDKY